MLVYCVKSWHWYCSDQSMCNPVYFLEETLAFCLQNNVSDIHGEPVAQEFRIRYRTQGTLHTAQVLRLEAGAQLTARLKVLARLESRSFLQDGRFSFQGTDFRVSVIPVYGGEKWVIRILATVKHSLAQLGMSARIQTSLLSALRVPGLIIVGGATGSGKTTTVHALLQTLNREVQHIVTLEDPIEYVLPGVTQIAITPEVSFHAALRSVLRQDPDVLFLGEIRDSETAQVAVRAALTGHTVLATIHVRDTSEISLRLLDLGVNERLITAVLTASLTQYLECVNGSRRAVYELRMKNVFMPFYSPQE